MLVSSERNVMSTRVDLNNAQIQKIRCLNKSIDDLNSSYVPQRLQNVFEPKVNGFTRSIPNEPLGVGFPTIGFYVDRSSETRYPAGYKYTQQNYSRPEPVRAYPSYGFYANHK